MTTIEATEAASKITSITLSEFLASGGKITKLETINAGDRPDDDINVFECEDRDGTFTSDNACVSWIDATFERVIEALLSGDVSDLPDSKAISTI